MKELMIVIRLKKKNKGYQFTMVIKIRQKQIYCLTFQPHMQPSPNSQWLSYTASVCGKNHQGKCKDKYAGLYTQFGSL